MRRKFPAECFFIGLLWLWSGCSAPHDNYRDPASPYYHPPDSSHTPLKVVLSARVRSVHISRIFPTTDSYSVIAELTGRDIALQDSASVSFDSGPRVPLLRTDPATWATIFAASYFQDPVYPNLGNVVGRPFLFYSFDAREADSVTHEIGPAYMWRVIVDVPLPVSPKDTVTLDTIPAFIWRSFAANFPFGYEVNVVNLTDGFETNVWTSPVLSDTFVSFPDSIADGDYYWTITVEDSFENSSRSKEGTFAIRWPQSLNGSSPGAASGKPSAR